MKEKLKDLVDRLAVATAELKQAEKVVDELKGKLIGKCLAEGIRQVDGSEFTAVISTADRNVVSYALAIDEIVQTFGLDEEKVQDIIRWNTRTAEGVPSVRLRRHW